jgi:hypothetical protein
MEFGSHEVQKVIMIMLLVATGALALLCDYIRIRMNRASIPMQAPAPAYAQAIEPDDFAIGDTLVPEMEMPDGQIPEAQKSQRAARLAAALRQPRRLVSADVLAVLERGSQDEGISRKTAQPSQKKSRVRHAS